MNLNRKIYKHQYLLLALQPLINICELLLHNCSNDNSFFIVSI
jgi:hypothetical protein